MPCYLVFTEECALTYTPSKRTLYSDTYCIQYMPCVCTEMEGGGGASIQLLVWICFVCMYMLHLYLCAACGLKIAGHVHAIYSN